MILFLLCSPQELEAQESTTYDVKNQFELWHDNDFVLLSDRYYSTGVFVSYRRRFEAGIFPSLDEQLTVQFQQQAYTPDDITTVDVNQMDRPYAGYTGGLLGWSITGNSWMIEPNVMLGQMGPSSGAGDFQRWFHRNATHVSEPSWVDEIEDSFHANFLLRLVKEWQLAPNPFSVHFAVRPTLAYGTKDVFVEPEVIFFFGRRTNLNSSVAYHQVGSTEKEIFFTMRLAYRYISHDATLQGNRNGDNSVFTLEPSDKVIDFGMDVYHRSGKNDFKLGFHALSPEAPDLKRHKYLSLAYARSF